MRSALFCAVLVAISATTSAEDWPTLEQYVKSCRVIVLCETELRDGEPLFKVVEEWKGQHRLDDFNEWLRPRAPAANYLPGGLGLHSGRKSHAGQKAVFFFTGDPKKEPYSGSSTSFDVNDGKLIYAETGNPGMPKEYTLEEFKKAIVKIVADEKKRAAEPPIKPDGTDLRMLPDLRPVSETDKNRKLVDAEIARITTADPASLVGNKITSVGKLQSKVVETLFPRWDFYVFKYDNYAKEGVAKAPVAMAASLGCTLAVARDDAKQTIRLSHYGNDEAYGDLLKRAGVVVRDVADAQRVAQACFAIHRSGGDSREILGPSDNEWKIVTGRYDQTVSVADGVKTIVKRTHFRKIVTEPSSGRVVSWKHEVETSDKRTEPAKL